MKILFIKRALNSRLYNQALALKDRGHEIALLLESPVSLGYSGPGQWKESDIHKSFRTIYSEPRDRHAWGKPMLSKARRFRRTLEQLLKSFSADIIISGNDAIETEDARTQLVIETARQKLPVVYDCQDFLTDCFPSSIDAPAFQRFANEQADAVVHTSPRGLSWAKKRYSIMRSMSFSNYVSRRFFSPRLPKLSMRDRKLHLVYCGGVSLTPPESRYRLMRDMRDAFSEIASLDVVLHLHLGAYPGSREWKEYRGALDGRENIIFHDYLPYKDMMRELTRYDIGLFCLDRGYLQACLRESEDARVAEIDCSRVDTSKQYEYVLAGLPVLATAVTWVKEWVEGNGFGCSYSSIDELREALFSSRLHPCIEKVITHGPRWAMEEKIPEFETFLAETITDWQKSNRP